MVFVVACRGTWFAADVDTFHFTVCQRRARFLFLLVSGELSMCGSLAAPLLVCPLFISPVCLISYFVTFSGCGHSLGHDFRW